MVRGDMGQAALNFVKRSKKNSNNKQVCKIIKTIINNNAKSGRTSAREMFLHETDSPNGHVVDCSR